MPRTPLPRRAPGRHAYTLLEVIVTLGIAVLLLAALYWSMNVVLGQQHSGRNLAEHTASVRSLLSRLQTDIQSELPPLDPRVNPSGVQMTSGGTAGTGGSSSGGSGSSAGGTTGTGSGTQTGTTSGGGASTSGSGTSTMSNSSTSQNSSAGGSVTGTGAGVNGPVVFNLGVQGDDTHLTLFVSQFPGEVYRSMVNGQDQPPVLSDLRRVTYWLASGGGLARQELKVATTADALAPFSASGLDEKSYVIGGEVVGVQFRYYGVDTSGSGSSGPPDWQSTWDGTALQPDGKTPVGPPLAIAVTLQVRAPGATSNDHTVTYRHVVAIPTANNFNNMIIPSTATGGGS